ncbi:hypothetical protein GGR21_003720 [Dysgonomonas hofstadii]|uniref:Uncharacterized protein n=1 Tax=Dysgonomonas hofstadii TaxID=637886 RepID=A0A840CSY3_9BACT|nr:hypothetical protein [Dysgonomonas hofstadii]MBB4037799.1 hypothetical protein [Dysgonomonas hofstadii]
MGEGKKNNGLTPKMIYSVFMAIFYLFLAILLIFTSVFDNFIQVSVIRIILGVLFGVYALFRAYRVWREFSE